MNPSILCWTVILEFKSIRRSMCYYLAFQYHTGIMLNFWKCTISLNNYWKYCGFRGFVCVCMCGLFGYGFVLFKARFFLKISLSLCNKILKLFFPSGENITAKASDKHLLYFYWFLISMQLLLIKHLVGVNASGNIT